MRHLRHSRCCRCCHCWPCLVGTMGTTSFLTRARGLLHIRNQLVRECLAELLATFMLIVSRAGRWAGVGGSCGWDRADDRVVAGTRGLRALLLVPWGWRGLGLHYTQKCKSALPVLPLGPCSHSMVRPVPWLWCNQGVVLGSVCLDTSCLTAGKGWGSGAILSI